MNKKLVGGIYVWLGIISIMIYLGFVLHSYTIKQCQDKYGFSHNEKRKQLGIPRIPENWSIKERDENYMGWSGNEKLIGHKRKSISFSGCDILGELDVFKLTPQNGEERLLELKYSYSNRKENDTLIFNYQVGNYSKIISATVADSIFKAENINRHY